ncbi:MAG: sulfur reduction protein DsrE, partial [Sulfolobaceae archaeon]
VYMRNLADKIIKVAKIGCFPDFYKAVVHKVDLIITI